MGIRYGDKEISSIKYCNASGVLQDVTGVVQNGSTVWSAVDWGTWPGLKIMMPSAGSYFTFRHGGSATMHTMYTSTDDGNTWTEWGSGYGVIDLATTRDNQVICIRGTDSTLSSGVSSGHMWSFSFTDKPYMSGSAAQLPGVRVHGDITSLINFTKDVPDYCFANLFGYQEGWGEIAEAPDINVDSCGKYAFCQSFYRCSELSTAPKIVVNGEVSGYSSFQAIFKGCPVLTTVPLISAGTYGSMSLHSAFSGCSALRNITVRKPSFDGCNYWMHGVASSGTFHCTSEMKAALEGLTRGESNVPDGWDVVDDVI